MLKNKNAFFGKLKKEPHPITHTIYKINSQMIISVKHKTTTLLGVGGNERNLCDFVRQRFLHKTPKLWSIKILTNWTSSEIKNFCSAKDTDKRWKYWGKKEIHIQQRNWIHIYIRNSQNSIRRKNPVRHIQKFWIETSPKR